MQLRLLAGLTLFGLGLFAFTLRNVPVVAAQNATRVPVIVELFTSEGCSSCPAADALLRRLEEKQPVPNADIIVLGNHVDYWNYIGWTDRFSSADFSQRQQDYSDAFHLDGIYTPQMVVNGHTELNGADESRAKKAIAAAAGEPRVGVGLSLGESNGDLLKVKVQIGTTPLTKDADVVLAVTEAHLETVVKKGENDGRTLNHTGVVRALKKIGDIKNAGFQAEPLLKLEPSWKRENLRAIVFVQEKQSRHILGAAALKLVN